MWYNRRTTRYGLHHYLYHPSKQIRTPCTPKPHTLPPLPPTAHLTFYPFSPSPPSLRIPPLSLATPHPSGTARQRGHSVPLSSPEGCAQGAVACDCVAPRPTTTRMSPHPSADSPVFPANRLGPSACGLPQAAAPCADARCPHIHHKRMIRPETTLSSYKTRNLTKKSRVPPLPFGEKQ